MKLNEDERIATARFPELQRIIKLKSLGWMFLVIRTHDGEISGVKGMRMWKTPTAAYWADMLQVRSETDAIACRLNPLKELVWLREGALVPLVDALLDLPHPDAKSAPHLVIAGAVPPLGQLWTPGV